MKTALQASRYIKSTSHHHSINLDGNVSDIPEDVNVNNLYADFETMLTHKEFLEKWGKKLIGEDYFTMPDDDSFDENGNYNDVLGLEESFIFNIVDGGEVYLDFGSRYDAFGAIDFHQPEILDENGCYERDLEGITIT